MCLHVAMCLGIRVSVSVHDDVSWDTGQCVRDTGHFTRNDVSIYRSVSAHDGMIWIQVTVFAHNDGS